DIPILFMSHKIIPSIRYGSSASQVNIHLFRMPKPTISVSDKASYQNLCQTLHSIVQASPLKQTVKINKRRTPPSQTPASSVSKPMLKRTTHHDVRLHPLIALGASTGGTEALSRVLSQLSTPSAAVVIVQHIPAAFGASFVAKLNKISPMNVIEAHDGDMLLQGHVYVGVGTKHFFIERDGHHLICRVKGKQRVSGHCPSVNVLFDSVAKHVGSKAVGGLLTGMGEDGATGLKKMRDACARTLAQDEKTSVVWGMPGAAVKFNAVEEQAALPDVARRLMQLAANGVR
ncbi:MAG: CheB methylesterase domain-containing protein, partial [Mariprofundaceae bacterium]|nr:CheB methylesterase domain-containing protein [Mariprofundaceae bacterium]